MLRIVVKQQTIESPRYKSILMDNDVRVKCLNINWQPVSFNRILRFSRYIRYVSSVYHEEMLAIKQSFKLKFHNMDQKGSASNIIERKNRN